MSSPVKPETKAEDSTPLTSVTWPKERQKLLKWNGWGYADSGFKYINNVLVFTGSRYPLGSLSLPYFTSWVRETMGADFNVPTLPMPVPANYPTPNIDPSFMTAVSEISYSVDGQDRLFRSHGHTLRDIFYLRTGRWDRIPDLVLYPESHEQVVVIVKAAGDANGKVLLIPYGGGTSVTGGLSLSHVPTSITAVSVDLSQMNRILDVDTLNYSVRAQSGIIGQHLEASLRALGYTTGHEPDSYEFSSLGGWVATRASGMKKNTYGNIEDLLLHVKMVTGVGVLEKYCKGPRVSAGPDIHHFILGSEGTLGIITEVTLKIRPLPPVRKYGSVLFPNLEAGVSFMRELARAQVAPSSVRLMDNAQFGLGHSLRPPNSILGSVKESLKFTYLTKVKGYNLDTVTVTTLLFEGTQESVARQEAVIYKIAGQHGGLPAGSGSGERGYLLTFVIAYIRDIGLDYGMVAESFETSVPWDKTLQLCTNVKKRVNLECKAHKLAHWFITCRVTQTYASGSCVYFYFAFNYTGIKADPVEVFEEVEDAARDEILKNGGSISHHHGVGRIRSKWMTSTISPTGLTALANIKKTLDPHSVFSTNVLPPIQAQSKL